MDNSDAIFFGGSIYIYIFSSAVLWHTAEVGRLRLASGNELRVTGAQACEMIFVRREVQVLLVMQRGATSITGRRM